MKAHGIPDYEKVKKERDELARQVEELKELLEAKTPEAEIHEKTPKPAKKSYDELVQEIIDNHQDLHHTTTVLTLSLRIIRTFRRKNIQIFSTGYT